MTRIARLIFTTAAWVFVAGVLTQVFFAGMVVAARRWGWSNHIDMGYLLSLPIIVMVIAVFLSKFPRRMKLLTLVLAAVYLTQILLIWARESNPMLSAFHPVMALLDFGLGTFLAWQATGLLRETSGSRLRPLQSSTQVGD